MATIDPAQPVEVIIDGDNVNACTAIGMTYCVSGKSAGYGRGLVDPFHGSVMPRIASHGMQFQSSSRRDTACRTSWKAPARTCADHQPSLPVRPSRAAVLHSNPLPHLLHGRNRNGGHLSDNRKPMECLEQEDETAFISIYNLTVEYQVTNTASVQVGYGVWITGRTEPVAQSCIIAGLSQDPLQQRTACSRLTQAPAPFYSTRIGYNAPVRYTDSNAVITTMLCSSSASAPGTVCSTRPTTPGPRHDNSSGFYGVPATSNQGAYAVNVTTIGPNMDHPATTCASLNGIWSMTFRLTECMWGGSMPFCFSTRSRRMEGWYDWIAYHGLSSQHLSH